MLQGFFVCGKGVRRMLNGLDLQRQTLRLYGELVARQESWAGRLVFACGAGMSASGLPAAVSIAGGTCLLLDPDAAAVKSVFRTGGVDFVVNTLDEALRVVKNEIRKHRPLSVALVSPLEPALEEMGERGVLPDLCVSLGEGNQSAAVQRLNLASEGGMVQPSAPFQAWLNSQGWSEIIMDRPTLAAMRDLDARLLEIVPDVVRRTWLQRIGHYQRATAGSSRVAWLTDAEHSTVES